MKNTGKILIAFLFLVVAFLVGYFIIQARKKTAEQKKGAAGETAFNAESCPATNWKGKALQREYGVFMPSDFGSLYGFNNCEIMDWAYELKKGGYSGPDLFREADNQLALSKGMEVIRTDGKKDRTGTSERWENFTNWWEKNIS